MTRYALLLTALLFSQLIFAQPFTTAGGLRLGTDIGLTLQQRIAKNYSLEFLAQQSLLNKQATVSLLAERHFNVIGRAVSLYGGGGPRVGWYKGGLLKSSDDTQTFGGVSGIGGVQFKMNRLLLSADYKPSINFGGAPRTFESQAGVSVRYILAKAPKKEAPKWWPFDKNKSNKEAEKKKRREQNRWDW